MQEGCRRGCPSGRPGAVRTRSARSRRTPYPQAVRSLDRCSQSRITATGHLTPGRRRCGSSSSPARAERYAPPQGPRRGRRLLPAARTERSFPCGHPHPGYTALIPPCTAAARNRMEEEAIRQAGGTQRSRGTGKFYPERCMTIGLCPIEACSPAPGHEACDRPTGPTNFIPCLFLPSPLRRAESPSDLPSPVPANTLQNSAGDRGEAAWGMPPPHAPGEVFTGTPVRHQAERTAAGAPRLCWRGGAPAPGSPG